MSQDIPATNLKSFRGKHLGAWIALVVSLVAIVIATRIGGRSDPARPVALTEIASPGIGSGFSLLLITFDTTRPDHLGCYGNQLARTPTIDRLADHGVRFDDAIVSAPLTLPSHSTIMTGLHPYTHGVHTNDGYQLAENFTTLAESLKSRGYATAAFVSCFVLDRRFGLAQGFDTYDFQTNEKTRQGPESVFNERPANEVTDATIAWFEMNQNKEAKKPFFVWVHYYDPHHPYRSPLNSDPAFAERPYDAEISFADRELGRLLDKLKGLNLIEKTLVVFTTDHGESLDEHGESTHGLFIYEATIRSALIFSSPALFPRAFRVSDRIVGAIDITPTIIDLLGIKTILKTDGISLLTEEAPTDRAIYIESLYPTQGKGCAPIHGLRSHEAKYLSCPKPEYYDLTRDSRELNNLHAENPSGLHQLEKNLLRLMSSWPADTGTSSLRAMSSEEIEKLRSLGYVSSDQPVERAKLPDAKDMLPLFKQTAKVSSLVKEGKLAEALQLSQEIAAECEGYETPIHTIAEIYEHSGRRDEAAKVLEDYVRKHPSTNLFVHAAKNYLAMKQWEDFERSLQAAEALEPLRGSIPLLRGDRYFDQGDYENALIQYERAFEIDGNRMGSKEREKLERTRRLAKSQMPNSSRHMP